MVIRARPKYISPPNDIQKIEVTEVHSLDTDLLYFNTGRSALFFLLSSVKEIVKLQRPTILMQSFNCKVVSEAAIKAGWEVWLADISNRGDFSVNIDGISRLDKKPNAILLTHYQGIPNLEYEKIVGYCRENNILVIEDLAQCYSSEINNVKVGNLGDFYIESYAFDKPFCCWKGGSLKINNKKYSAILTETYSKLKTENGYRAKKDIGWMYFLLEKSEPGPASEFWNDFSKARLLFILCFLPDRMFGILGRNYGRKLFKFLGKGDRVISDYCDYKPKKLNNQKKKLVQIQKVSYDYCDAEVKALEKYLGTNGYHNTLSRFQNLRIHWNRYSLLDETGKLKELLCSQGVETGNHNWPVPLHKIYSTCEAVRLVSNNFTNSEKAAQYVVNIPVWSTYFQEITNAK